MQKNQKFKNNNIEKLCKILDNISIKELPPEDEKYLRSLSKKLEKSFRDDVVYKKVVSKKSSEKKIDYLKPKVTIHPREVRRILEFPEVKEEKIEVQIEKPLAEPPLPVKEPQFKDEDVFEIEKVEISEPKFIEVKPKVIEKREKEEIIEKKVLTESELTEWEPVETVKEELEEEKIEEEKKSEVIENFCNQCGAKLIGGVSFCPECGNEIKTDYKESKEEQPEQIEKNEHIPEFIPVKKVEDKKEQIVTEEEPAKLEEPVTVEIPLFEEREVTEEPSASRENKIEIFKELESIDEKTAVILYDNGYKSVEELTIASLKDLTKIKGINKKTAKKIKKEIEKKSEPEPVHDEVKETEEIIEKKADDKTSQTIEKKKDDSYEFIPIITDKITEEKVTKEQIESKEKIIEKEEKIDAFKEMDSIDNKTAVLLYNNGFTTIDSLKQASLKDLTKIKGIKRKTAKNIKKEIEQKFIWKPIKIKEEENFNAYLIKEELKKDDLGLIKEKIPEYEFVETDDEIFEIEEIEDLQPIKLDDDEVFKNIKSIDEKIAKLLKENGINSIKILRKTTIKDLTKIRGIKKNIAKKIKKEITELSKGNGEITSKESEVPGKFEREENPFIKEDEDEWISFDEDSISRSEMTEVKGFRHGDYTLYRKEILTKSGKKRTVQFFSKGEPEDGEPIDLPEGYEIKENIKNGIPYLKKKK